MAGSSNTLADMDARFARSHRRAAARRRAAREPEAQPRQPRRTLAALFGVAILAASVALAAGGTDGGSTTPHATAAGASHVVYRLPPGCRVPLRFQQAFVTASRDTGLPLSLLVAVAYEESSMNPAAQSRAGALGLLQLMPATAQELRLDPMRPETNILAGARYLRAMVARFGDTTLALSAYNAGPGAVERAGGAPSVAVLRYAANIEARAATLGACDAG